MDDNMLLSLADQFGTPTFVFDTGAFQRRMRAIRELFGADVALCFAVKANPFLIPAAAQVAERLEVCSPGELDICKALGIDMQKVVFSGVNKTPESVRDAADAAVGVMTVESFKHARLIEAEGARRGQVIDVLVRLNAGSQFGMSRDDLIALVDARADYPHLNIVGIHYFAGTQRKNLKHQSRELKKLTRFIDELESGHGLALQRLEYGPGLAVPVFQDDDFSDTLAPARQLAADLAPLAQRVELTVEMGRFFCAECGTYLSSVNDTKFNEDTDYVIVDGGINHLTYIGQVMGMKVPQITNLSALARTAGGAAPAVGEDVPPASARIAGGAAPDAAQTVARSDEAAVPVSARTGEGAVPNAAQTSATDAGAREWCVCGSLCSNDDVLTRAATIPDVREGDVFAFANAGAYAVTEGIHLLLSRPMPRIVLVDAAGNPTLARDLTETSPLNTAR